jgi:hypothetical protein
VREALPHEGRSYDLVWLLDAALLQRRLSVQHMRKLGELFADYVKVCTASMVVQAAGSKPHGTTCS